MKKFIKSQIDSFNGKKYKQNDFNKSNFLNNIKNYKNFPSLFIIKIKNNKIIYDKSILEKSYHIFGSMGLKRKYEIINILQKMLDKYKVKDTTLIINYTDGYNWRFDLPVFNFSLPIGCQGLIFPNFDIFNFMFENKKYDFDEIKNKIKKFPIIKNENNIFFTGTMTSIKNSKIREKIQYEKHPLNVILDKPQFIGNFKKYKYLLDLPGYKPWSLRLKYLFVMNSLVFRVSFYNSKNGTINDGEKGCFQQSFDYLFKENRDYIHLLYDFYYDKEIPNNIYKKIVSDIKDKYSFYENNQNEYKKIVSNMKKASKKLNLDEMLKYLYTLVETYTEKLLI
jgi:hypothetical protein